MMLMKIIAQERTWIMHKVVDCYIKGFDKADNGCVNIRLQPMFQKVVPGWLQRELKEE